MKSKKARTFEDISKVFAKLVFQGKLTAAIKLLDSESSTGLLNLTPEVLEGLKEKHPEAADIWGLSLDLKSSKINTVGKRSLDGKENSKLYLR